MTDRDEEDRPERRRSVLDDDQRPAGPRAGGERHSGRVRDRRGVRQLLPVLIFAAIVLMIARQEVPAVSDWWDRTFSPEEWSARQVCRKGALARAPNQAFARVIDGGEVHRTSDGLYIDGLILGEMGEAGSEVRVECACYLNAAGDLVKLTRTQVGARAAAPVDDPQPVPAE